MYIAVLIIIIIIIPSIITIEPVFSLFVESCFECYSSKRKKLYALLTSLKHPSAFFGDTPVKYGQCLSGWYIFSIFQ